MKRISQLFQCLVVVGLVCACSSAQAQQYKYVGKISFPVGTPEYVVRPYSIAFDSEGLMYIVDAGWNFQPPYPINPIRVFNTAGKLVRTIGTSGEVLGLDTFTGIAQEMKFGSNGFIGISA